MNIRGEIRKILKEELFRESDNSQILYHASNELFDKFELKKGYRTHLFSVELTDSHAIFLTPDIDATKQFGEKYLYKCKIHPKRTLDWREYLDIRSYEWFKKQFGNIIPWERSEYWMLLDDKRVIDYLHHRGIDCVIITELGEHDQFDTYAMLNPSQIEIVDVIDLKTEKIIDNDDIINENFGSDYKKWKRNNVTIRGIKESGQENKAGAILGKGLYTAFLSNKELARQYGKIYFVVGAIPENPVVFNDLNQWEIWFQNNLVFPISKSKGREFPDIRDFNSITTIEDELQKMGYDGVVIKGREIVNYNPENIKYFSTEDELHDYWNDFIKKD